VFRKRTVDTKRWATRSVKVTVRLGKRAVWLSNIQQRVRVAK
jgi:hypothetical protein